MDVQRTGSFPGGPIDIAGNIEAGGTRGRSILRLEKNLTIQLVLLAAPFCGILLNGYEYGTQDHEHYLPEIIHWLDPSYFPGDYLLDEPSGESTLWIPAMAYLCRWLPLELVCFAGYLAFQYLLFWAVYHLALNITVEIALLHCSHCCW